MFFSGFPRTLLQGCDPQVYLALGIPSFVVGNRWGHTPFHQVYACERVRIDMLLDDFPFRALSRDFHAVPVQLISDA